MLYAIAMADYDQDGPEPSDKLITTREGIKTIALHSSSIGRSVGLPEPFLVHFGKPYIFYYVNALLINPYFI